MNFNRISNSLSMCEIKHECLKKGSDLVSFKVGGDIRLVAYPKSISELITTVNLSKGTRIIILGNGSNTYFSDSTVDAVVISTKYLNKTKVCENRVICQCGVSLNRLVKLALNCSLSGVEFLYGIPGSIGGAVYMNASAFGKSVSNITMDALVYDTDSQAINILNNEQMMFSIKDSVFKHKGLILLECHFVLSYGEYSCIKDKMTEFLEKRMASQPLNMPSAGSVFVNPKGKHASMLIDSCGLKGLSVGGAQVSTKHAGFIVNTGGATSNDINSLIGIIKEKVYNKYGIELKEEIIYIK